MQLLPSGEPANVARSCGGGGCGSTRVRLIGHTVRWTVFAPSAYQPRGLTDCGAFPVVRGSGCCSNSVVRLLPSRSLSTAVDDWRARERERRCVIFVFYPLLLLLLFFSLSDTLLRRQVSVCARVLSPVRPTTTDVSRVCTCLYVCVCVCACVLLNQLPRSRYRFSRRRRRSLRPYLLVPAAVWRHRRRQFTATANYSNIRFQSIGPGGDVVR